MNMEEILDALLTEVEAHPEQNIEEILIAKANKYELSKESIEKLKNAFLLIDKIDQKQNELNDAYREGKTREQFVHEQLDAQFSRVKEAENNSTFWEELLNKIKELIVNLIK